MGQRRTATGGSSVAKLFRLSLASLTFIFFFYSTTLLWSYFYPLDWAWIRILNQCGLLQRLLTDAT
jgi:hypothetical protein